MTTHKWTKGDRFKINPSLSMENENDDKWTGVVEEMLAMKDQELEVTAVLPAICRTLELPDGVYWIVDKEHNYVWRTDWVTPMIEETI